MSFQRLKDLISGDSHMHTHTQKFVATLGFAFIYLRIHFVSY